MANGFAINSNEPIVTSIEPEIIRDLQWFKEELQKRGVGALEIAWGDHVAHFHEVPEHLLERYVYYRSTLLHRQALEATLSEDQSR